MDPERNKATIREWVERAWNGGEDWIAQDIFAPEFVAKDHDSSFVIRGPDSMAAYLRRWRGEHPDIHFTIDALVADDDLVAGFFTVSGIRLPRKSVGVELSEYARVTNSLWAADVWRFRSDGKIIERIRATVQDAPIP